MALQVIGAGLPRTGTTSLKAALEQLLGGSCYHMFELFERNEEDGILWWQALEGDLSKLDDVLDGWAAAIDWPTSLFWRELVERHPDALVVLSHRGDAETWWASATQTVWESMRRPNPNPILDAFTKKMRAYAHMGDDWDDPSAAKAYYDRHFDLVVEAVPAERLLIWQPTDGWPPLCDALGVAVPDGGFFHRNDEAEFRERAGFEDE